MFSTKECLGRISCSDQRICAQIIGLMSFLCDVYDNADEVKRNPFWPNCHSSCRALKIHLGDMVEVIDGFLMGYRSYLILKGDDVAQVSNDYIEHSWLLLPDGATVDPFPAGVYATSPLIFPPFGMFQNVLPTQLYSAFDGVAPFASTDEVWARSKRIAQIFQFYPLRVDDPADDKDFNVRMDEAVKQAVKFINT